MNKSLITLCCLLLLTFGCIKKEKTTANQLRFPIETDPPTLDWSLANEHVAIHILFQIQEGLTKLDKDMKLQPALAEKWSISPDGKTYTFTLRDAKWSDGVTVKAQDFVSGWQRVLEPANAAEYAYFLYDLENAEEFNSKKISDFSKVGVKAINDKTLEVKLKHPASYFLHIPANPVAFPQRADILKSNPKNFFEPPHLRSTGPFMVLEWKRDNKLVLVPNPYYYGTKPSLEKVILYVVKEDATALRMYEKNELDVTLRIPPLEMERVSKLPDFKWFSILRGYYYSFNTKQKPFDNANVRKAFAHAINREEIVSVLKSFKMPCTSWIPKGLLGYQENMGLKFDPQKAAEYLKKAGFPEGKNFPEINMVYDSNEMNKIIAEKIQFQLKKNLNLSQVRLETMEWKVYLDKLRHQTPAFWRLGWGADYPDPHNFMDLFQSKSGQNHTQWGSPLYDKLVLEASSILDSEKRIRLYEKIQKLLLEEEAITIPILQETITTLIKPHVKDFTFDSLEFPRFENARIEK